MDLASFLIVTARRFRGPTAFFERAYEAVCDPGQNASTAGECQLVEPSLSSEPKVVSRRGYCRIGVWTNVFAPAGGRSSDEHLVEKESGFRI